MSKTHQLTTSGPRYKNESVDVDNQFKASDFTGHNKRSTFGFVFVDADHTYRSVFQGPLLQGPYLGCYARATVIDNYGGSGAEDRRTAEAGLMVDLAEGDVLEVEGLQFRAVFGIDIKFELVDAEVAA